MITHQTGISHCGRDVKIPKPKVHTVMMSCAMPKNTLGRQVPNAPFLKTSPTKNAQKENALAEVHNAAESKKI